ncbi:MAG: aromatic-ring-hydroxylating dioxygenase subunit beta [Pseudomonadales bacterium]|nr:aromatic-ring-hydroxylating dioxygenase subunit beta [Pseudomonadales bacterium]
MNKASNSKRPLADNALPQSLGSDINLRLAVENFLYHEAELLDTWCVEEWLALWTEELSYLVPSTDKPDGDPRKDLLMIQDDRFLLHQRVRSIVNGTNWAENPRSTIRRSITNVQAKVVKENAVEAKANFVVYRSQAASLNIFPGHAEYLLETGGPEGFYIRMKRAVLDLEELRPHGRVAFIL